VVHPKFWHGAPYVVIVVVVVVLVVVVLLVVLAAAVIGFFKVRYNDYRWMKHINCIYCFLSTLFVAEDEINPRRQTLSHDV